ncbi:STT3 domain-containing protein [Methanobacterium oryzae]|uniref:STT3 domain-containing protein n=1 Tax=Methanobacterium oryzae TaxID=69540 RepID=UPI003D234420
MKINENKFITIGIILLIFLVGSFVRVDSINLNGVPINEKSYFQDPSGLPYMYELDSYYNYRLTQNYVEHGYMGDTIINGTEWDLHSYYPGVPMDYPPLIVYLTAFIYKLINLFSQIPLLTVCFWLPAFIGPLCGIPAYFFVSRLTNDYGGLVAGILAVTAPFYFMRTVPGWFDTDMFNIIFPILIMWFFIEAVQSKNTKMQLLFAGLSAFFMFLFSTAWNGWQYLFYVIIFSCAFYMIWRKYKGKNIKEITYVFGTFFIVTIALILIFTGFLNIIRVFNIFESLKLFGAQNPWSIWPDSYMTVSELRIPSLDELITKLSITILVLGIFGIFLIASVLLKKDMKSHFTKIDPIFYLLLVVWTVSSFFALIKGIRFIILLLPPLIISSGIAIGIVVDYLKKYLVSRKKDNLIRISSIIVVLIVVVPAILNINTFLNLSPGLDDDVWDSAEWIHNNTPNNTVVITEWSYGHLFTGIADRPMLYDGRLGYIETVPIRQFETSYTYGEKSPSVLREYWVSKGFSTSNESLSLGIFRMLSTSGDLGYLTLDNYTQNTTKTAEALNSILGVDKNTADEILINKYHLDQKSAENVLKYTHPNNPNNFVIMTSDEMIGPGHWMFNFGEWNFKENQISNYTYSVGDIKSTGTTLNTSNGIKMNVKTNDILWNGKIPYFYEIITENRTIKHYLNKNSDFGIILRMDCKKAVVIDKKFENSIFTKLVIERSNSTSFKTIYENKKVNVWKIS